MYFDWKASRARFKDDCGWVHDHVWHRNWLAWLVEARFDVELERDLKRRFSWPTRFTQELYKELDFQPKNLGLVLYKYFGAFACAVMFIVLNFFGLILNLFGAAVKIFVWLFFILATAIISLMVDVRFDDYMRTSREIED